MTNRLLASAALVPAALAMATTAVPAHAAQVTITTTNPVIELSVYETVKIEPDVATITAGVDTSAVTAVEALRENSVAMQRVIDLLKQQGVDPRDIQTARISLNPQYDYEPNTGRAVFRAYQASNQVSVKLRDIKRTGEVLDALVSAGATNVYGPMFSIDDSTAAKAEARKRGLARGLAQAEEYARAAGYSGVRLLQVQESIFAQAMTFDSPMAYKVVAEAAAAAAAPIEPGLIEEGVTIALTYEMVR
jgi:uncharacterized protein YggE